MHDRRQQAKAETIEVETGYKEKFFHREDSQAVEQVVQGGLYPPSFWKPQLDNTLSNLVWFQG